MLKNYFQNEYAKMKFKEVLETWKNLRNDNAHVIVCI